MAGPTTRATVKRNARRAEYDVSALKAILASDQICHVAYVVDGEPRQIPTLYFCDDQYLYLHGNRQSALLRHVGGGGEVCVTVTLLDGVVVARSGFHCSMNYRSVTLFGCGETLAGLDHQDILDRFVSALVPGHEKVVREPTTQELAATAVVRIPLVELSGKVRTGGPDDDEDDLDDPVWAGQIPIARVRGEGVPSNDLKDGIDMPDYIKNFQYRG
jgi:nitroimidazol reductase NimA-like FMN-containing flavoprotein (pyridoxamine 5'-phosphate oxidase superfamily)